MTTAGAAGSWDRKPFRIAIVCPPSAAFARGITTSTLGPPDLALAEVQHAAYRAALADAGIEVVVLPADPRHPDSTFVEDAAVMVPSGAVLTRPGAPSRRGEVESIRRALEPRVPRLLAIQDPGTLDGGDVCEAGRRFFVGISQRTNPEGAEQLAAILAADGCDATLIDIREHRGLLHLKSAVACLEGTRMVIAGALADHPAFADYEVLRVARADRDAANCVLVNGRVLLPAGHPRFEGALRGLGYRTVPLEMTEFQKMDGGVSCLSLRLRG